MCLLWFLKVGTSLFQVIVYHDDVIKWKHFPRYWPFVQEIHWSPVSSLHKGQWRGALMVSLICAWLIGSANNREAGDLRCHCAHYDVTVIQCSSHNCIGSSFSGYTVLIYWKMSQKVSKWLDWVFGPISWHSWWESCFINGMFNMRTEKILD